MRSLTVKENPIGSAVTEWHPVKIENIDLAYGNKNLWPLILGGVNLVLLV